MGLSEKMTAGLGGCPGREKIIDEKDFLARERDTRNQGKVLSDFLAIVIMEIRLFHVVEFPKGLDDRQFKRGEHQFDMVESPGFVLLFEGRGGNQGIPPIKKSKQRRLISEENRRQFDVPAPLELIKKISNFAIIKIKRTHLDALDLPIPHLGIHLPEAILAKGNFFAKERSPTRGREGFEANLTKRCCRIGFL